MTTSTAATSNPVYMQSPPIARPGIGRAASALHWAATCWFGVAVLGQLLFVVYLTDFYGSAAASANWAHWNKVVPHAYIPGDTPGNLAMGMHVLFAVILTIGGALQIIPQVRRLAPRLHRWNGRVYVLLAVLTSLVGLYLMWFRSSIGDLTQHLGLSGDALLIMLCAYKTVRHARAGKITLHRQWALRLFMVVSAVWFFRVGLLFWIMINQAPAGFDPVTFTGPTLSVLSFAQYLLPLAVLELYLRTQDGGGARAHLGMAVGLVVLTLAMAIGIFAATVMLWLPRI